MISEEVYWFVVSLPLAWFVLSFGRFIRDKIRGYSEFRGVRGNVEWPLIANLPMAFQEHGKFYDLFLKNYMDFGQPQFMTFKFPFQPRYFMTMDPEILERVMKTEFTRYEKGPVLNRILRDLLGHGIFAVDGAQWLAQRKTASNIFFVKNFRDFFMRVFWEESVWLCRILEECCPSTTTSANTKNNTITIDLFDLFNRFTLQSFLRIGFDRDLKMLQQYWQELRVFKQQLPTSPTDAQRVFVAPDLPFAKAFERAQAITDYRLFNTLWFVIEWLDGSRWELKQCLKQMDAFVWDVIRERRRRLALKEQDLTMKKSASKTNVVEKSWSMDEAVAGSGEEEREPVYEEEKDEDRPSGSNEDLLSRFMAMRDEDGNLLSDQQLRDVVMNMIIAGRDTTAQALSWCVYELSSNPEVVQELRDTLDEETHLPEDVHSLNDQALSFDELQRWKYGHAVISETLRKYPSVPKQAKQAMEDVEMDNGLVIPAGSWIVWSSWVMGRLEKLWGSTVNQFDPKRFMTPKQPSTYQFISFNAGPRLCLGKNMAYLEAQTALALVYKYFDLNVVNPESIHYGNALTLPMKNGLLVSVKRRSI